METMKMQINVTNMPRSSRLKIYKCDWVKEVSLKWLYFHGYIDFNIVSSSIFSNIGNSTQTILKYLIL